MKVLIGLLAALVLTPAAFAASPFLPISATNTFASGERQQVEAAVAQAEAQGKLVYIDMQAAWCGPCYNLGKSLKENAADIAPTLAHFVSVELEEMHLEMTTGADFLPTEIPWFPSLFVYNPANQKWTMIFAFDEPSLKTALNDYLTQPNLGAYYAQRLTAKIQAGTKVSGDEAMEALVPLSYEGTGAEILAATTSLVAAMKANPTQFDSPVVDMEAGNLNYIYQRAVEAGKLTFAQIRAADADSFPDLATSAYLRHSFAFEAPLGYLTRTQGNKAASDQCAALSASAAQAIAKDPASTQRGMQIRRDLTCLMLQVELKEKNGADVLAYEKTLTAAEGQSRAIELARTFAMTGTNFDKAIEYGKAWQKDWVGKFSIINPAQNAIDSAPLTADRFKKALADVPRVNSKKDMLARVVKATDERLAAYAAGKTHP